MFCISSRDFFFSVREAKLKSRKRASKQKMPRRSGDICNSDDDDLHSCSLRATNDLKDVLAEPINSDRAIEMSWSELEFNKLIGD